jgi:hypothetical protein
MITFYVVLTLFIVVMSLIALIGGNFMANLFDPEAIQNIDFTRGDFVDVRLTELDQNIAKYKAMDALEITRLLEEQKLELERVQDFMRGVDFALLPTDRGVK